MAFPVNVDSTWVNPSTVTLDGGELRRADAAIFAGDGSAFGVTGGVVRHGDLSLSVTVNASDNVTIQPGAVVIPGNAVAGTGVYRASLAAATTNALTPRNATNARIDLIVFRQLDTDVVGSHGAYTARIEAIAGTPSATPSAPTLPSMAVELARITVPATGGGTATVDSSFRTYATAIGATLRVPTAARLPASAAKWDRARALDTNVDYQWSGTAWVQAGTTSQSGIKTCNITAVNTTYFTAVTFPQTFATVPRISLTPEVSSPGTVAVSIRLGTVTTSGFEIAYSRSAGSSFDCHWIAST